MEEPDLGREGWETSRTGTGFHPRDGYIPTAGFRLRRSARLRLHRRCRRGFGSDGATERRLCTAKTSVEVNLGGLWSDQPERFVSPRRIRPPTGRPSGHPGSQRRLFAGRRGLRLKPEDGSRRGGRWDFGLVTSGVIIGGEGPSGPGFGRVSGVAAGFALQRQAFAPRLHGSPSRGFGTCKETTLPGGVRRYASQRADESADVLTAICNSGRNGWPRKGTVGTGSEDPREGRCFGRCSLGVSFIPRRIPLPARAVSPCPLRFLPTAARADRWSRI